MFLLRFFFFHNAFIKILRLFFVTTNNVKSVRDSILKQDHTALRELHPAALSVLKSGEDFYFLFFKENKTFEGK